MRNKILSISIFLMVATNTNGDTTGVSQESNAAPAEQCGTSHQVPGPRHHRSTKKQSSCTKEKEQSTNQSNASSSEKAK